MVSCRHSDCCAAAAAAECLWIDDASDRIDGCMPAARCLPAIADWIDSGYLLSLVSRHCSVRMQCNVM